MIYNIGMNFLSICLILCFVSLVFGYFFGSLMWSIIIGKFFFKKDPRDYESMNAGATNSSRIFGKKVGLIVLFLDVMKGFLPTFIMWLVAKYGLDVERYGIINNSFNTYTLCYLAGLAAIIGHCYPIFFKFKGGKGVATFGAFLITISPFGALIQLLILIVIVFMTKYVSLGSLLSSAMSWVWMFIPGINYSFILNTNIEDVYYLDYGSVYWLLFICLICFVAILLIWIKHKNNIIALKNKTERKFTIK